jgi:DNA-binding transcriptional ArsR family regulator
MIEYNEYMDTFSALAVPIRRSIIEMLATRGRLSATEICDEFQVSPPAISQHLKVLREANLVEVEKRSRQRIYHISPKALCDVEEWAHKMTGLWNGRLDRLGIVLEDKKRKLSK